MDRRQIGKIAGACAALVIFIFGFNHLELLNPLKGISFSREVFDASGELLRITLTDDQQYRTFRPLKSFNPETIEAVLLTEDRYFFYHFGFNPVALGRAVLSLNDVRPMGASTITMQMVRLRDKQFTKSWSGKLKQIIFAVGAEFLYSKKQILEAYLNLTPYGANIEGLGTASRIYFNKDPAKLSTPESLLLAVIPQNPTKRNLDATDSSLVLTARDRLYQQWKEGHHTVESMNVDVKLPLLQKKLRELPFRAPHFVNYVLGKDHDSFQLKTSLDLRLQDIVEKKIDHYLQRVSKKGIQNAAAILINPKTNQIQAWVGSGDFFNDEIEGQNDGVLVRRSPGSALKPFLYGLAMDEGLIHPQSLLFDTASSFGSYDPENFDHTYKGPITAEEALIQSRNVPAIYLASRLKHKSLFRLLNEADINFPHNEKYYGLALTLGTAEVSMYELAGLYTALAHQGQWSPLSWKNEKTKVIKHRLLSEESTFMVLDMLRKNPRAESEMLDQISKEKMMVAWKTGTSYGYRDAWTAGLIGDHVLVVWLGNFDNTENPALIGRELAAPLFFDIAQTLKSRSLIHEGEWNGVLGLKIKSVDVCGLTGNFPSAACPHKKKTWFFPGVSSIEECQVHREVLISNRTGKRICQVDTLQASQKEVFEFWPSDVIQLFEKFGIPFKKIPDYELGCETFAVASAPEIVSPKADVKYTVRFISGTGYEKIPLKAKVDQDIKKLYWFADQRPLGESSPNEALFAEIIPGHYQITVVDDHGQTVSRALTVETL